MENESEKTVGARTRQSPRILWTRRDLSRDLGWFHEVLHTAHHQHVLKRQDAA